MIAENKKVAVKKRSTCNASDREGGPPVERRPRTAAWKVALEPDFPKKIMFTWFSGRGSRVFPLQDKRGLVRMK